MGWREDEGEGRGKGREEGRGGELPGLRGRGVHGTDGRKDISRLDVQLLQSVLCQKQKDHVLLRKFPYAFSFW